MEASLSKNAEVQASGDWLAVSVLPNHEWQNISEAILHKLSHA